MGQSASNVLRIGMFRTNKTGFWHPQSTVYAMFYTARQFDIELFLFGPDDIDFEQKTVHAMFLEKNDKVYRTVPFPRIVDNSLPGKRYEPMLQQLEQDCVLVRHSLNTNKLRTYNRLRQEGSFKSILIPTLLLEDARTVPGFMEKFGESIVIKPLRGARGIGVLKITRQDGAYLTNYKNESRTRTFEEFLEFYKEILGHRTCIIQPYIRSRTKQGNPFDIRIHARRGAGGHFQVHLFPRIGNAAGLVSNISSGGFSMDTVTFLQREFPERWKNLHNELLALGATFPEYYQSFYDVPIFDVGMDMGIHMTDGGHDLRMYEVNTYIDGPFFEIEDAITHFEYYRYLESKLDRKQVE